MSVVKENFSRLRRNHGSVFLHDACDNDEMSLLSERLQIATCGEQVDLKKKFNQSKLLKDLTSRH
ncbi:hypothetical protein DPMN_057350 [Dreissena polymorpha]|uniref:Uncharacterized protein n=1 Tax=Dreissena polymorpha TaxID=45954 RepID=A0A9D4BZZ2_DREPO|nr:hypothetical protein DPMN_057350 [Dreissena polymorpha]